MATEADDPTPRPRTIAPDGPAPKGPLDIPIADYAQAASLACVFELKCRLVADNAELGDNILTCPLEKLIDRLVDRFGAHIDEDDVAVVKGCQVLRNKLLHLELSRHAGKLRALGDFLLPNKVWSKDLTTGELLNVGKTNIAKGRVYGWIWESHLSGALEASEKQFAAGLDVIEKMAWALAREDSSG